MSFVERMSTVGPICRQQGRRLLDHAGRCECSCPAGKARAIAGPWRKWVLKGRERSSTKRSNDS